jgi:hypothetical protein
MPREPIRRPRRPADPPIPPDAVGLTARISLADRDRLAIIAAEHRQSITGFLRTLIRQAIEEDDRKKAKQAGRKQP